MTAYLPKLLQVQRSYFLFSALYRLQAPDGTKGVKVGSVIAVIGEEGDDLAGAAEIARQAASQASKAEAKEEKPKEDAPKPSSAPEPPKSDRPEAATEVLPKGDRIFATPIAKKIALERGIPLAKVKGTGPGGRIIREDIENYKAPTAASSEIPSSAQPPAAQLPADYTDAPISNMRRTIGTRLTQSKQELPHYYLTVDITMDKALKLREVFNKTLSEKDLKLSVNDFIVKAAACALADVPEANSAWLGEVIRT
jgi:pyruvate dehydrogenase E2 component (dihydrolipoamide acetyltransferase)